jgi:hypothetical protein
MEHPSHRPSAARPAPRNGDKRCRLRKVRAQPFRYGFGLVVGPAIERRAATFVTNPRHGGMLDFVHISFTTAATCRPPCNAADHARITHFKAVRRRQPMPSPRQQRVERRRLRGRPGQPVQDDPPVKSRRCQTIRHHRDHHIIGQEPPLVHDGLCLHPGLGSFRHRSAQQVTSRKLDQTAGLLQHPRLRAVPCAGGPRRMMTGAPSGIRPCSFGWQSGHPPPPDRQGSRYRPACQSRSPRSCAGYAA